jgi:hypothetical protein
VGEEYDLARFNQLRFAPKRSERPLLQIFERALALLDSLKLSRLTLISFTRLIGDDHALRK